MFVYFASPGVSVPFDSLADALEFLRLGLRPISGGDNGGDSGSEGDQGGGPAGGPDTGGGGFEGYGGGGYTGGTPSGDPSTGGGRASSEYAGNWGNWGSSAQGFGTPGQPGGEGSAPTSQDWGSPQGGFPGTNASGGMGGPEGYKSGTTTTQQAQPAQAQQPAPSGPTTPAWLQALLQSPVWAPPQFQPGQQGGAGDPVLQKLLAAYDIAIPYMQSPNLLATPEGQALRESIVGPMRDRYETMKEQILQEAAQRGLGPDSGVVQQQLADLDRQFLADQSAVDRQFISTYYQRLTDSLSALTNLLNLEDSRNAAALGQAMAVDESQRQALLDLLALATGQGNVDLSNATAASQSVLNYATQLGQRYLQLQGAAYQGLGQLAQAYALGAFNQPQQTTGLGSLTPSAAPTYSPNALSLASEYSYPGGWNSWLSPTG